TEPGCTILVKLRQMQPDETQRIVTDTTAAPWQSGATAGLSCIALHSGPDGETVAMQRLAPGSQLPAHVEPAGEEIFLVAGDLADEHGAYRTSTWIRNPAGFRHELRSAGGAVYWVKRGHLPPSV